MVNKDIAVSKIKDFLILELENASKSSPIIAFTKPIMRRIIDNNYTKLSSILNLVADEDGNIDSEGLLSEMTTSLLNTDRFAYHTNMLGDIIIGGGEIKMTVPLIEKCLIFNTNDLNTLKQMLRQP